MNLPLLKKNKIYYDKRGFLGEIYKKRMQKKNYKFILFTSSKKNVFRGLHIQSSFTQEKKIYLIKGKIFDICIDLRKKSKTFRKIFKYLMLPGDMLTIPRGFAHGYYTLGSENILLYIMDNYQSKKNETGVTIYDKKFNFKFKNKRFVISKKDQNLPDLKSYIKLYCK